VTSFHDLTELHHWAKGEKLMRSALGTLLRAAGASGIALSALLVSPAVATADEQDPVLPGSCQATVAGADGAALALDAGAPLDLPGLLTLGLGADSATTGPLLTLPLRETVDGLGVSRLPIVPEVASGSCAVVQGFADGTGNAVQALLPGEGPGDDQDNGDQDNGDQDNGDQDNGDGGDDDPGAPGDGEDVVPPGTPPTGEPEAPEQREPQQRDPEQADEPITVRPIGLDAELFAGRLPATGTFELTGFDTLGTAPSPEGFGITAPEPVRAPGVDLPDGGHVPETHAEEADGTDGVVAMPVAHAPERLPLIVALLSLLLVIAALVRAWYSRKAV
jgi:hypothetical protein